MSRSPSIVRNLGSCALVVPLPDNFPAHPSPESLAALEFALAAVAQVTPGAVRVQAFVLRFEDVEQLASELLAPRLVREFGADESRRSAHCLRCLIECSADDYRRRLAITKRITDAGRERYKREQSRLFSAAAALAADDLESKGSP